MLTTSVESVVLDGFDDTRVPARAWDELVRAMRFPSVFLTHGFQRTWWESFAPGRLLLIATLRDGHPVALAPLFVTGGMGFLVGSGSSDYLDLIGDVSDAAVLDGMLQTARDEIPGFIGFRFHHVHETSPTGALLEEAAKRSGLRFFDEGHLNAPVLRSQTGQAEMLTAANKKSLRRHENRFRREGLLSVRQLSDPREIEELLPEFFAQHVARWDTTDHPSLFLDPAQRAFYERLVPVGCDEGWLRFTVVRWNDMPIAFHFGFCFEDRYLWYKPSFDPSFAKGSPGEVLLRHLLLGTIEEGIDTFDLGLGDEAFKARFANDVQEVHTWALYDESVVEGSP